ncbi:MAG: hypothetical protein K9H14_05700 [Actinomycetia bacterium]|nr:hypothetical protein [Actinomycetes bacterium]
MNKKEKVKKIVSRTNIDCFPTQIDATPEMKTIIGNLLQIKPEDIDEALNNHLKYLPLDDKVSVDEKNGIQYDIGGVGWDLVLTEGFHIRHHPLTDDEKALKYKFPEPKDDLLSTIHNTGSLQREQHYILSLQDWTLFERLWLLRGYEKTLMDLHINQKLVNYLLDGIIEFHVEIARKLVKHKVIDGIFTGSDVGTQMGMVMSPDTWRKYFKPGYKKIWGIYKENGLSVFHHSCGNIMEIIPDLIDIGLDVLNPIQPEAMDLEELSNRFGKELSFFGGISTQRTLPFGTPEQVKQEVIDCIETLGKNNGYIISPSHEVTSDCKPENFLALVDTLQKYRDNKLLS